MKIGLILLGICFILFGCFSYEFVQPSYIIGTGFVSGMIGGSLITLGVNCDS